MFSHANSNNNNAKNERQVISNFTKQHENTMGAVVSASIAKVILLLTEKYFNDETIDACYAFKIKEMTQAAKSDEEKAALAFIFKKIEESVNQLDNVTIYDPTQKKSFQTYQILLKQVLVVVWTAIHDSIAYAHHFEGTDDERLKQATADTVNRVSQFFQHLIRIQNNPVCHHGIRNEIVFFLNHTYHHIDIIEDARFAIYAYLKEHLFNALHDAYQNKLIDDHTFKNTLLSWMQTNSPLTLMNSIDPSINKQLRQGLNELFVAHGSDPNDKLISDVIDQSFTQLDFHCDEKNYFSFAQLNRLVNEIENKCHVDRSEALVSIKEWIKSTYQLNDIHHQKQIDIFCNIYDAHQQVSQSQSLLRLAGKMTDEVISFTKTCDLYFKAWVENKADIINKNENFPIVTIEVIEHAKSLLAQIDLVKKDKLTNVIENFFAQWYLAIPTVNREILSHLYINVLLNPIVQQKIRISDDEIQQFLSSANANNEKDITPYEINRIFLYAIINEPDTWSPLFFEAFSYVLHFVDQGLINNNLAEVLKKDSYPKELRNQLFYLKDRYEVLVNNKPKKIERPITFMILLPEQVRTAAEWTYIANWLKSNQTILGNIYQAKRIYFENLLLKEMDQTNVALVLASIPDRFIYDFINLSLSKLNTFINNINRLWLALRSISEEYRYVFIQLVASKRLDSIIENGYGLENLLKCLSQNDQLAFIQQCLSQYPLSKFILKSNELFHVFNSINQVSQAALIQLFEKDFLSKDILYCWFHIQEIFQSLHLENRYTLLEKLGGVELNKIVNTTNQFAYFFSDNLPQKDWDKFLQLIGWDTLKYHLVLSRHTNSTFLSDFLNKLPQKNLIPFIQLIMNSSLKEYINDDYHLNQILDALPQENWDDYIRLISLDKVKSIVKTSDNLAIVLHWLGHKKQLSFMQLLGRDALRSMIKSGDQLARIFEVLSLVNYAEFVQLLGYDRLQSIIEDNNKLMVLFASLESPGKMTLIQLFNSDLLIAIIKDVSQLTTIFSKLSVKEQAQFIQSIGGGLKAMIKTADQLDSVFSAIHPDNHRAFRGWFTLDGFKQIQDDKRVFSILKKYFSQEDCHDMVQDILNERLKDLLEHIALTYQTIQNYNKFYLLLFSTSHINLMKGELVNAITQALYKGCEVKDIKQLILKTGCHDIINHYGLRDVVDNLLKEDVIPLRRLGTDNK